MTEVGIQLDGGDTVVLTLRIPASAFESAGLSSEPANDDAPSPASSDAASAADPAGTAVDPGQLAFHPGALGEAGQPDTSPPSDGNNPTSTGRPEPKAKTTTTRKASTTKSRSGSRSRAKTK